MADHAQQLKKVPLFTGIPDAQLQRIANGVKERRFEPGAEIISTADFEKAWSAAQRSPLWHDQLNNSRAAQWGDWR